MFEEEQSALRRLTLEDEQRQLIEQMWDGKYWLNGTTIPYILAALAIELARGDLDG
ncbi:MAG: hypothetical protein QFB87_04695 [Patescibacteria group bacterium]|nr:hypothetical protein [Patescibacteria group bacterium]